MPTAGSVRAELRSRCPELAAAIFDDLAPDLIGVPRPRGGSRDINDPIWKLFTLSPAQASIVDLPLMQRLRRVRQLGLAHLVYPGAQHSRLEHSIGTMRAAAVMFAKLSRETRLEQRDKEDIEELISVAALLHDCGHTAFSHLGERVLGDVYGKEFHAAQEVLQAHLQDPISFSPSEPTIGRLRPRPLPAAEIISVLFVLSPTMEALIGQLGLRLPADRACLSMAGMIMGRPSDVCGKGTEYHHYIKAIVSGDIDCDKIDYVARDAYYAGLPISADVDRLLSQLATAKLTRDNCPSDLKVQFGAPSPDTYYLLGIRPAGASALEMFVMTRSYLFERIYTHHKVRAAERAMERLLRHFLQYQKEVRGRPLVWCLRFLLERGGDDAVLDRLSRWDEGDAGADENFRRRAHRILDRDLPQRALALSLRTLDDFRRDAGRLASATFNTWSLAFEDIAQNTLNIEDGIDGLLDPKGDDGIYLDWVASNPVKENPDIWVHDPSSPGTLLRVNRYFDVEQLSNAYRDVKLTGWIFCDRERKAQVAAAAAYVLHERYDLLPGAEAFRRAKVPENEYRAAFVALRQRVDDRGKSLIDNLLDRPGQRAIKPPPGTWLSPLGRLDEAERLPAAEMLSGKVAACGFPRGFYDDFQFALVVLEFLVRHQVAFNRHALFADATPRKNEKRFQDHLRDFLSGDKEFSRICTVEEHTSASGGSTDLIVRSKDGNRRPVIVELKSEQTSFGKQYEYHAGQPLQYAEAGYGRVTILYCQYASEASVRPADTLDIRKNDADSAQLTICLGQRAFAKVPSAGGATTVAPGAA